MLDRDRDVYHQNCSSCTFMAVSCAHIMTWFDNYIRWCLTESQIVCTYMAGTSILVHTAVVDQSIDPKFNTSWQSILAYSLYVIGRCSNSSTYGRSWPLVFHSMQFGPHCSRTNIVFYLDCRRSAMIVEQLWFYWIRLSVPLSSIVHHFLGVGGHRWPFSLWKTPGES